MKKRCFISALIVCVVVAGLSQSRGIVISNETETSGRAVKDDRMSRLEKARANVRQTLENMKRKLDDKEQEGPLGKRYEGARSGTKDNVSQGPEWTPPHSQRAQTPPALPESEYLKEIASVLSVQVSKDDTPGDIAFKIKQCLGNAECYRGEVLSDESFELARSAIGVTADAETFAQYHKFIKKVAGRKVLIIISKE